MHKDSFWTYRRISGVCEVVERVVLHNKLTRCVELLDHSVNIPVPTTTSRCVNKWVGPDTSQLN